MYTLNALDKKTVTAIVDEMVDILTPEVSKRAEVAGKPLINESPADSPRDRKDSISKEGKDKDKKKKVKGISSVESGFESVQGRRKTMEDTHVIIDDFRVVLFVFECND